MQLIRNANKSIETIVNHAVLSQRAVRTELPKDSFRVVLGMGTCTLYSPYHSEWTLSYQSTDNTWFLLTKSEKGKKLTTNASLAAIDARVESLRKVGKKAVFLADFEDISQGHTFTETKGSLKDVTKKRPRKI